MDHILADSEKEKLREVVKRMLAGEKGLHTKTIGKLKLVRTNDIPWALIDLVKRDAALGRLTFLKRYKGIDFYERKYL